MANLRHITLPAGFRAAGVACGIKVSGRNDVAIVAADRDCSAAVVTTLNQVVGAPVLWCRHILPKGFGLARGIVVNAGCSNVCTGQAGFNDAQAMAAQTARLLGTTPEKILVASTGVIGHRLPMAKVRRGIAAAGAALGTGNDSAALQAIMTTDTREKSAVVQDRISGRAVTVAGMVKGSGMIAPSMATLIGIVTTDAAVAPAALHKALTAATRVSFNAVTVDSDTSTSDTVAVLASGRAGNPVIAGASSPGWRKFAAMLAEVCGELARAVAADGEGATRLVEIHVRRARTPREAEIAAKAVANSPLFKCAVHGGDPNWGRIAAALGKSTAKIDPARLAIRIAGTCVFARGAGRKFDPRKVSAALSAPTVVIDCDLGLGRGEYTALTCDLSREYIAINADYHT